MYEPAVSVIIPTHNRAIRLGLTLDALITQTYPRSQLEVVVVADGCTDNTIKVLQRYRELLPLKIAEQLGRGAAAARNHGARIATGELLVFMDDDIEAAPHFVRAHVEASGHAQERVVTGYLEHAASGPQDQYRILARAW